MSEAATATITPGYSELQAMCSAAGWYVGTVYVDEDGCSMPGSRDSEYFRTRDEAQSHLAFMQQDL